MDGEPVWYARYTEPPTGTITCYTSADHADATVVRVGSAGPASADHVFHSRYDTATGRLQSVTVPSCERRLWFVEDLQADAEPPAVNLIAFGTADFPRGTVIDNDTFEPLAIRSDAQLGAVRWWSGTGQVHQIYVAPRERRQRIGFALLVAADAYQMASGSAFGIWASGDRTDLGEALAQGLPFPQRVRPLRRRALPMTPAKDSVGVPTRNLYPEP